MEGRDGLSRRQTERESKRKKDGKIHVGEEAFWAIRVRVRSSMEYSSHKRREYC